MRSRTLSALLVALALTVPVAPTAAAAHDGHRGKSSVSAKAKKAKKAKKPKHANHKRGHRHHDHDDHRGHGRGHTRDARPTVLTVGGLVTSVDVAGSTLTFTVRVGRDKTLRNKPLTVTVATSAKITRNDRVVQLGDIFTYDHVNARVTKIGGVYTATRVSA